MVQMNIDENRMPGLVAMLNERDVHGIYFLNRFASPPAPIQDTKHVRCLPHSNIPAGPICSSNQPIGE